MITFESKDVSLPDLDFDVVGKWLDAVAKNYCYNIGRLNYLFCDDREILRVNREFLGHDYFTDIITFDYSGKTKVSGDIFISLETVRSNSEEFKTSYISELLRVIVHGLLHLCGIDDKGPGEREIMEHHENEALKLWNNMQETAQ